MKRFFCIAMLCFVCHFISAQNDSIPENQEEDYYTTIKDIRESEKFRVGIDISTPTVGMLSGAPLRPRLSFIFNKKIAPNRALRFIPAYEQSLRFSDFNSSTYNAVMVTDTSVVYRNEYQEDYRVTARLGTEWFKQYERNTMVYGIDAVIGFHSEYCSFTDSHQPYDENGVVDNFTVGPGFFQNNDFYSEEIFRLMLGIDFSVGYKFYLGERADVTIEWIPEITYRPFIKSNSYGTIQTLPPSVPEDFVRFDFRGLALQLHYKFLKK